MGIDRAGDHEKRIKLLTIALSVSCAFNIGLMINFGFMAVNQMRGTEGVHQVKSKRLASFEPLCFSQVIDRYFDRSMEELMVDLKDCTYVEEGYKVRDIALSFLVHFHFFNLDQALGQPPQERRVAKFQKKGSNETFDIPLFPGLKDSHFLAIEKFLNAEKWPITAEGLFEELKKEGKKDPSLIQAFYKTAEFEAMLLLVKRNKLSISKAQVIQLMLLYDYLDIKKLARHLMKTGEFTLQACREFLMGAVHKGSTAAATLLVEADSPYVLKICEDEEAALILKLLKTKTDKTLEVLKGLIASMRSEKIRKEAALRLYVLYADELAKEVSVIGKVKKKQEAAHEGKSYRVKEGDTLYKIAKAHGTSVEKIIEWNGLERQKPLKVGVLLTVFKDSP